MAAHRTYKTIDSNLIGLTIASVMLSMAMVPLRIGTACLWHVRVDVKIDQQIHIYPENGNCIVSRNIGRLPVLNAVYALNLKFYNDKKVREFSETYRTYYRLQLIILLKDGTTLFNQSQTPACVLYRSEI
jgi:hypothetical protein